MSVSSSRQFAEIHTQLNKPPRFIPAPLPPVLWDRNNAGDVISLSPAHTPAITLTTNGKIHKIQANDAGLLYSDQTLGVRRAFTRAPSSRPA